MRVFRHLAIIFCFVSSANAWNVHGIAPTGGKSQLNFNFLAGGNAYLLINHFKSAVSFGNADGARGGPAPDTLNSNGYPTSISHSGVRATFYVPSSTDYAGTWNVKWVGGGTVSISNTSGSSCAFPCSGTNQSITGITFSSTTPTLTISALTTGITDIAVYRADEATNYTNGEVFSPAAKTKIAEGGFGVLRYLNLQEGNLSNTTQWADRTPLTYAFYGGYIFKSAYYAGSSGGTSTAYTATLGSGAPTDRQIIHILWHADATTTTPTLSLNGTTALPIVNNGGGALVLTSTAPENGRTSTLVFDAGLNKYLLYGGNSADFNQGIVSGVPPELLVQLANELGMNPWFVSPPYTTNPLASGALPDYMPSLITYTQANLNAGLVPRFEGINEPWNTKFAGTNYAAVKSATYAWAQSGIEQYQGMAVSLLAQAAGSVYSNNHSLYQVINGVQQTTGTAGAGVANSNPRMTSASWVAKGAPTATGYSVSAASNFGTRVAPSSYIGSAMATADELAAAYSYNVTNAGNPTAQAALADLFIAGAYIGSPTCTPPYTSGRCFSGLAAKSYYYTNWFGWAVSFGSVMTAYEGGWSPDYFTVGSSGDTDATGGSGGGNAVMTAVSTPGVVTTITLDSGSAVPAIGMAVRPIGTGTALSVATAVVSISAASPAQVTWAGNTLLANQPFVCNNGSAPTGMTIDTVYYVLTPGNPFTFSATAGGAALNTSGSAGSCTGIAGWTVTGVSGQVVTLGVDSSSFGTSSAGTAQYMGAALSRNNLRYASKARPSLTTLEIDNMNAFVAAGGVVPSDYEFTGNDLPITGSGVWTNLLSQFTVTSPRWDANKSWNASRQRMWLLKRDLDPASNDNDPMWLAKAA